MENQFDRSRFVFGNDGIEKLFKARVIVFGVGGVGGYVVEALARSGVGHIDVVDKDCVSVSNINRQIIALHSTVGRDKVEVIEERIHDINPECVVTKHKMFYLPENADCIDFKNYDYVIDCIDTVSGKIEIICRATVCNVPVISAMGAGNKIDPSLLKISDIYKTSVCPLARVMRNELKKRHIRHLKCVYSTEKVIQPKKAEVDLENSKKPVPGSNAFVPSVAGLLMAGEVVRDLVGIKSISS